MLTTVGDILHKALCEKYAVAAANVGNSLEVAAALEAAAELRSPVILDVLQENLGPCPAEFCRWMRAMCQAADIPAAINIEDEKSCSGALRAAEYGATSIMAHRFGLDTAENLADVKEIAGMAKAHGISVEASLDFSSEDDSATAAKFAAYFAGASKADCLAPNLHGTGGGIDFERLAAIRAAVPDMPLVLHGTLGLSDDDIRAAVAAGINKVNLSKGLKAAAREAVVSGAASDTAASLMKKGFRERLRELISVCGSVNKA